VLGEAPERLLRALPPGTSPTFSFSCCG